MKRRSQPCSRAAGEKPVQCVGHLDDEVAARDVAGDRYARARVLGGVDHKVRGGWRRAVRSSRASGAPATAGPVAASSVHASRPGDLGGLGEDLLAELGRPHGGPLARPDPREASMSRRTSP